MPSIEQGIKRYLLGNVNVSLKLRVVNKFFGVQLVAVKCDDSIVIGVAATREYTGRNKHFALEYDAVLDVDVRAT